MRVPGFADLYTSLVVGRVSGQMVAIALILFVLARYQSPQLAGLTAFFAITPGLVVSPIAGALLDPYGRARLVMLDYIRNATLRGLALTLSIFNLSWGVLNIAIPVLVLGRLHGGPASVGILWGAMGAAGLVSALVVGRLDSRGRERRLMFVAILISVAAMALLPFASSVTIVFIAMTIAGLANGPFDIGLFTLRQRRTDPAWFGRAFAISMSVNWMGTPIGSALAGPVIAWSLDAALWAAVVIALVSAVFPLVAVPARDEP